MRKSLGLLEIKGLASAIVIADAMAKTAAVTLVGIETCKGGGWQTIKVTGDVAAVQASLQTGSELAKRNNCFIAQKTLSRPDQTVFDTWGKPLANAVKAKPVENVSESAPLVEEKEQEKQEPELVIEEKATEEALVATEIPAEETPAEATCNICNDPLCPRIKGEPRIKCLHNAKVK